jgi:PKHD-type hydroxylase
MLTHIQNALSAEHLAECHRLLSGQLSWIDGRESAGATAARTKYNQEISHTDPTTQQLGEIVVGALRSNQNFMATALPIRLSPPSFGRYEAGQAYGLHNDAAVIEFNVAGSRTLVRTDLAATLFLCPPHEYDGGELVVQDSFGISRVKYPAGDMVLYPARSLHQVQPVTRGRRTVSFFWIQSMVRGDIERGYLRELDYIIQQLNRSAPGDPASLRLLGLYHNLLRLWCDT